MRKLLPYVRKNSSEIYVELGSSHIEVLSVDPNETGLFGSSLSLASRILLGDRPETGFRFKASYPDNPWRMLSEGEPYDYGQDLEYRTKVRRLLDDYHSRRQGNGAFLTKLWKAQLTLLPEFIADFSRGYGPEQAPKPEEVTLASMMEAIPSLKLLDDYLAIFPQIKKTRAVRDLTDMLRQEARNSRIGIRLMNSLVHQYFMKGI